MREIVSFTKEIEFKTMVHKITGISLEHTLKLTDDLTIEGDFLVSGTYKMTGASQIEENFSYKVPVDIAIDSKYDTKNLEIDIYDFTYEIINEEILKLFIDLSLDSLEIKEVCDAEEDNSIFKEFEDITIDDEKNVEHLEEELILRNKNDDIKEEDIEIVDFNDEERPEDVKPLFKEINTEIDLTIPKTKKEEPKHEKDQKEEKTEEHQASISVDSIFMAFQKTPETYSTYRVCIVRENDNLEEILNKYKITREQLEEYNNLNSMAVGTKLIIPNCNE